MADALINNDSDILEQLSRVVDSLDAALPKFEIAKPTSMPSLTPAQFDSLVASW